MREYSYYYAPKTVNALVSFENDLLITRREIYFGVRIQDLLLKNGDFYKLCSFFLLSELTALMPSDHPSVTSLIISNIKDAQRIKDWQ